MSVRDKIKQSDDRVVEVVPAIPEWDLAEGDLVAVSPSADERARLMEGFLGEDGKPNENPDLSAVYPALLIACAYEAEPNGDGFVPVAPAFNPDDEGWLRGKNGAAVERVALACMKVSGLDKEAAEAGKGDSPSTASSAPTSS